MNGQPILCPECGDKILVRFEVLVLLDSRGELDGEGLVGITNASCPEHHDLSPCGRHWYVGDSPVPTPLGRRLRALQDALEAFVSQGEPMMEVAPMQLLAGVLERAGDLEAVAH